MRALHAVTIATAGLLACRGGRQAPAPDAAPKVSPCEAAVATFARWAEPRARVERVTVPEGLSLVADDSVPFAELGDHVVPVIVGAGSDPAAVVAEVKKVESAPPAHAALAIAPDVPWRVVAGVTDALAAAGVEGVDFVFARADSDRPPRSPLGDELAALAGEERASKAGELLAPRLNRCPAAAKLFGAIAVAEPDSRPMLAAAGMPDAVKECGCALDVPSAQAIVWFMRPGAMMATVSVRFAGKPIPFAADVPWSKAYRGVVAQGRFSDGKPQIAK